MPFQFGGDYGGRAPRQSKKVTFPPAVYIQPPQQGQSVSPTARGAAHLLPYPFLYFLFPRMFKKNPNYREQIVFRKNLFCKKKKKNDKKDEMSSARYAVIEALCLKNRCGRREK